MLFSFSNEMFYFGINNVVGKPVIDEALFYILKFVKEDSSRGGWLGTISVNSSTNSKPETKTLIMKLESVLIKLYRQNV